MREPKKGMVVFDEEPDPVQAERLDQMFRLQTPPHEDMDRLKAEFRALGSRLAVAQSSAATPHAKRSFAEALTLLETASMFAVKGLQQG